MRKYRTCSIFSRFHRESRVGWYAAAVAPEHPPVLRDEFRARTHIPGGVGASVLADVLLEACVLRGRRLRRLVGRTRQELPHLLLSGREREERPAIATPGAGPRIRLFLRRGHPIGP